jgi:hypothetical protein
VWEVGRIWPRVGKWGYNECFRCVSAVPVAQSSSTFTNGHVVEAAYPPNVTGSGCMNGRGVCLPVPVGEKVLMAIAVSDDMEQFSQIISSLADAYHRLDLFIKSVKK